MTSLNEKFKNLSQPAAGIYSGIVLEDDNYIIARDSSGHPIFLIKHSEEFGRRNLTYELEGLEAFLEFKAEVSVGEKLIRGTFAFVRCSNSDEESKRYFLELCGTLSLLIGPLPTVSRVDDGINTLVRMFSLRKSTPKRAITGLLGELLFIDQHASVLECIGAWHLAPREVIDFTFSQYAVEVKTTASHGRLHRLTFEQARGVSGKSLWFLSVRVTEVANGLSGSELMRSLMDRCAGDLESAIRLWEMVGDTLGSSFQDFMDYCFAYEDAVESMQYYDSRDLPAIRGDLPVGISRVTFDSDFGIVRPVAEAVRQELLGFGA